MHSPIAVFASFAPGSICHHLQSLHKPQLSSAMILSLTVGCRIHFAWGYARHQQRQPLCALLKQMKQKNARVAWKSDRAIL
jgi:hypothetical protein